MTQLQVFIPTSVAVLNQDLKTLGGLLAKHCRLGSGDGVNQDIKKEGD
jgi:hypothetical protein